MSIFRTLEIISIIYVFVAFVVATSNMGRRFKLWRELRRAATSTTSSLTPVWSVDLFLLLIPSLQIYSNRQDGGRDRMTPARWWCGFNDGVRRRWFSSRSVCLRQIRASPLVSVVHIAYSFWIRGAHFCSMTFDFLFYFLC